MMQYDYLADLNDAQREAVVYDDGPALVIAGAGSGKTRVLVYKLLHLLHLGYDASRLMALTFTNKAAREMRSRVAELAGGEAMRLQMGTFHAVFLRILRLHAETLGYTPSFTIYNTSDSKAKIKSIVKLLGLDTEIYKPNTIFARISNAKNRLLTPEAYRAMPDLIQADIKADIPRFVDIYARYMHELKQSNAMDFDDMLLQVNILFRDHPEVLAQWQERIDYLLIDEYQDTNFAQYNIARMLMQSKGKIFVVGDDAQSIYSFRGANIDNILSFQKTFSNARLFKLEQNYRSSQTIVQASSALIAHNERQIHKSVYSLGQVGEPIELHEAYTGEMEASWVCKRIEEISLDKGCSYDSFAVLYRTNAQSRALEHALRRKGISFRIWGGRGFFDHKEIMDFVAYLRLVANPCDDEALVCIINYPKRGIGDTTISKVRACAVERNTHMLAVCTNPEAYSLDVKQGTTAKLVAFAQLIREMQERSEAVESLYDFVQWGMGHSGLYLELASDKTTEGKARLDNLRELLTSVDEYETNAREVGGEISLINYLNEIALLTDQDATDQDITPSITLMTIHASKGLEYRHVFIVGLEEQLFPSIMSQQGHELEEERRLFYVAITRAEETCHISYARERFRNGRTDIVRPSRFLRELPAPLLRRVGHTSISDQSISQLGAELPRQFVSRNFMPEAKSHSRRVYVGRRDDDTILTEYQQIGNLTIGAKVLHKRFGEGVIKKLEGEGDQAKAHVDFDLGGSKVLLLRFAGLQRID